MRAPSTCDRVSSKKFERQKLSMFISPVVSHTIASGEGGSIATALGLNESTWSEDASGKSVPQNEWEEAEKWIEEHCNAIWESLRYYGVENWLEGMVGLHIPEKVHEIMQCHGNLSDEENIGCEVSFLSTIKHLVSQKLA